MPSPHSASFRGYLLLHSVQVVDGEVCNGGFRQLLQNRCGRLLGPAAELARLLQRDAMAGVLTEAAGETPDLQALSEDHWRLRRLPRKDDLTKALWLFPGTHPQYFD